MGKKKYDFYIHDHNLVIEFHGIQHYEDSSWFQSTAKEQKRNDAYKEEKARKNGCDYLVIPYWDENRIDDILDGVLM